MAAAMLGGSAIDHGRFPGPTLADALRQVRDDDHGAVIEHLVQTRSSDWPLFQAGEDYFGHALVYEYLQDGTRVRLRSCGPNGLDDKGAGDDDEVELWIDSGQVRMTFHPQQEPSNRGATTSPTGNE